MRGRPPDVTRPGGVQQALRRPHSRAPLLPSTETMLAALCVRSHNSHACRLPCQVRRGSVAPLPAVTCHTTSAYLLGRAQGPGRCVHTTSVHPGPGAVANPADQTAEQDGWMTNVFWPPRHSTGSMHSELRTWLSGSRREAACNQTARRLQGAQARAELSVDIDIVYRPTAVL